MPSDRREAAVPGATILSIVIAVILFVAALIIKSSASFILLVLAAIVSGYDYLISSFQDAVNKDFLSRNIILSISCIILFIIGASKEGGVLFVACKLGRLFVEYAENKTYDSSVSLLDYCSTRDRDCIESILEKDRGITLNLYNISSAARFILYLALVFAVIFAASAHFLFGFSVNEAIRRAVALVVICNTFSIEAFSKSLYTITLCNFASRGVIFKSAQDVADCALCDAVAIEKSKVLSGSGGSVAVFSNVLDSEKMLSICAHAAYNSEQPFAKAICNKYTGEILEDLISDFKEIPGIGVGVMLSGMHVILASSEFFRRKGINIPYQEESEGSIVYYVTINETYAGFITIGESLNEKYIDLSDSLRSAGIESCALITDDDKETAGQMAFDYGFDYFYPNCSKSSATVALQDFSSKGRSVLYVNSSNKPYEDAVCNVTTERNSVTNNIYADSLDSLPWIKTKCSSAKKTEERNAVIAFVIKAFLLIVALSGLGSSWFSVFIDSIAAAVTILICWLKF